MDLCALNSILFTHLFISFFSSDPIDYDLRVPKNRNHNTGALLNETNPNTDRKTMFTFLLYVSFIFYSGKKNETNLFRFKMQNDFLMVN